MILAIIDGDRVEVEFFYTDSKNDVTLFSRCVHLLHVLVLACNIFCSDAISTFFFWITFVKLYKIYFFPILLLNKNRDRKNSTYTITHGVMRLCIVTCVTSNDAGTAWKLRIAICSVFFFRLFIYFFPASCFSFQSIWSGCVAPPVIIQRWMVVWFGSLAGQLMWNVIPARTRHCCLGARSRSARQLDSIVSRGTWSDRVIGFWIVQNWGFQVKIKRFEMEVWV